MPSGLVESLAPVDSIVELLSALVRTPSRAGEDDLAPVLDVISAWFTAQGLAFERLAAPDGAPLGLHARVIGGAGPGPHWLLDATLDTAGFGDLSTWSVPPSAATVHDGWLYGRGSADSKAGVAIFAHLLAHFASRRERFAGSFSVLFDLDEHSGGFGGARHFFERPGAPRPDGVIIGYPGLDSIVVGGRGFQRARLGVAGIAAHSGGTSHRGINAVTRAASLATALQALPLPAASTPDFPPAPQLTVTGLHGGSGFSQVPDRCEIALDIRLTPSFGAEQARALVELVVRVHDHLHPAPLATRIDWLPGWPAYRVLDTHPMVQALQDAGRDVLQQMLPTEVVGPSNIGNYLAGLGVPALCGFGVRCRGIHAADEGLELASIAPVFETYRRALSKLLSPPC
jgi:succinyl-diaminopimelate desuccinylase